MDKYKCSGITDIFGACANFLLQWCAKDFPVASRVVLSRFYMDDLLVSVESVHRAKAWLTELQTLHMKGNFNLTKRASNDADVFKDLKPTGKAPLYSGWNGY